MATETCERIVVVGGGFAGLSIAARLAQSGLPVTLLEAGQLGIDASTRNQGWLHSGAYFAREHPQLARQCHESLEQTLKFCPEAIEPDCPEMLYVFTNMASQRSTWTDAWDAAGIPYQEVPHDEACHQLAGVAPDRIQHAYRLPDRSFRPHVLLETLAAAARGMGAEIRTQTAVTNLLHDDRCVFGVRTGPGEEIHASRVVLATGAVVIPESSTELTPHVGEQSDYTRVILKTHLVSVQPELERSPFCVVDDDGFNHLPHWQTSVFGNGHWPVVHDATHRSVDEEAVDLLWQQIGKYFPIIHLHKCKSIREWAGTTMQILHVDQVEPGHAPLPTIVNHRHDSPQYEHLWSVSPGRATLWAHLAEEFRKVILDDFGGLQSRSVMPPWALATES